MNLLSAIFSPTMVFAGSFPPAPTKTFAETNDNVTSASQILVDGGNILPELHGLRVNGNLNTPGIGKILDLVGPAPGHYDDYRT
ncbi:MAG: hypothetical protein IPN76_30830 [Saprospiraceae bacterium]|nr:hypothetical protein [Saprospiraceae bacterium]